MASIRRVLALIGGLLLSLSGQSEAATKDAAGSTTTGADEAPIVAAGPEVQKPGQVPQRVQPAGGLKGPGAGASHANSGPGSHSNGVGHADFTKGSKMQQRALPSEKLKGPGAGASHTNSGPGSHSNGVGHADFTKGSKIQEKAIPAGKGK